MVIFHFSHFSLFSWEIDIFSRFIARNEKCKKLPSIIRTSKTKINAFWKIFTPHSAGPQTFGAAIQFWKKNQKPLISFNKLHFFRIFIMQWRFSKLIRNSFWSLNLKWWYFRKSKFWKSKLANEGTGVGRFYSDYQ